MNAGRSPEARTPETRGTHRRLLGTWAAALLAATLVGVFFASRTYLLYNAYPDNQITWGRALAPSLTSWYVWALLAPLILWLAVRFRFEGPRRRRMRSLAVHALAGAAFALVHSIGDHLLGGVLPWVPETTLSLPFMVSRFHGSLLTYAAIVVGWNLVDAFRRAREREVRTSQLETRLAEARLHALKMHLQPHFLFNTLHAISTLMHRDVDAAERMLTQLSDLLRMTLDVADAQEVRLKDELDFLERYLEIERTRFGDRLQVQMDAEPAALDARVPSLILQPLVENAVRHGVAPRTEGGRVEIRARREDGTLRITIEDDGPGMGTGGGANAITGGGAAMGAGRANAKAGPSSNGSGLGIANCRARLEQLYGDRGEFTLGEGRLGGLLVTLTIPCDESAAGGGAGRERPRD